MDRYRSRARQLVALLAFLFAIALAPAACNETQAAPADSLTASPDSTEMAAYCSSEDVIDAYSLEQIAEVTGDAGGRTVDETQVQRAVDDYGAHVSAHVRMQHPSDPFGDDHEYLNSLNVEGAFLLLQKRTTGGMEENLQDAEERLDDVLLKIAEGELELNALGGGASGEDGGADLDLDELVRAAPRRFGSHRWPERQRLA